MATPVIKTINKMIEFLPQELQEQIAIHLREYIYDLKDLILWDTLFKQTEGELSNVAKKVRKEIALGKAKTFDYNKL